MGHPFLLEFSIWLDGVYIKIFEPAVFNVDALLRELPGTQSATLVCWGQDQELAPLTM